VVRDRDGLRRENALRPASHSSAVEYVADAPQSRRRDCIGIRGYCTLLIAMDIESSLYRRRSNYEVTVHRKWSRGFDGRTLADRLVGPPVRLPKQAFRIKEGYEYH
jgi:hypothetical protein